MKKILKAVLILIFILALPMGVRSQMLWKIEQDGRAEKEYANPEQMDPEELALKAFHIVDYNIQGTDAERLLQTASTPIPEIAEYLEWRRGNEPDPMFTTNRKTLSAITSFLEKTAPGSDSYLWALYRSTLNDGNVSDNRADWDRVIAFLEKEAAKNPTRDRKALAVLSKIGKHNVGLTYSAMMDEQDYINMFALEEEALKAYPLENTDETLIKAELYNNLGNLKCNFQDEMLGWLVNGETATNFKPYCENIGFSRTFPSNSRDYLTRAKDIATHLLGEGHPAARYMDLDICTYIKNSRIIDADTYQRLMQDYDYILYYFPSGWFDTQLFKASKILDSLSAGEMPAGADRMPEIMDALKVYMGVDNPIYFKHLKLVGATLSYYGFDAVYWEKRLLAEAEEGGLRPGSDEYNLMMLENYSNILNSNPLNNNQDVFKKIRETAATYRKTHSPTRVSIALGNQIANFFFSYLYDNDSACEIFDIVLADLEKMYGKEARRHPEWWNNYMERTNVRVSDLDAKEVDKIFNELIATTKKIDSPYRDKQVWTVVTTYANYLTNMANPPEPDRALDLMLEYEALGKNVKPYASFPIDAIIANLRYGTGRDPETVLPGTLRALETAQKAFDRGDQLRLGYLDFDWAVNTLIDVGEFAEALRAVEMQTEVYNLDSGNFFTLDYFNIAIIKAKLLKALNRKTEAQRLMAECIQQLKMVPDLGTGPFLLDCLWDEYNISKTGNFEDMPMMMAKLSDITAKTQELKEQNPDDQKIYYYFVRSLTEGLYIVSDMRAGFRSYLDETELKQMQEFIDFFETQVSAYNIIELSKEVLDEYPKHFPDYATDPVYIGFNIALANYYKEDKQPAKAEEIYKGLLETPIDDYTKSSILLRLMSMASENQDVDLYGEYLEQYSALIESLGYLFDDDLLMLDTAQASYNIEKGNYEKALEYARDFYKTSRKILDGNFQLMTSAEQNSHLSTYGDPALYLCNMLELRPEANTEEIYDAVLYRTGMQLRSQRETLDAIRKSNNPEVMMMLDSLQTLRQEQMRLTASNKAEPAYISEQGQQNFLKAAEIGRLINYLEGKVLDATASLRAGDIRDISWKEIQSKLKPDEAAVEFVYSNKSIFALIVRPGYSAPKTVRLTGQADLMNLLKSQHKKNSAALAKNLYTKEANTLYGLLWQPMEADLEGVKNVYYTLPGVLNSLAFNSFKDNEGKYLFDRYNLNQLTTTGQLVFDEDYRRPESMVVMGNILYGHNQRPADKSAAANRGNDDEFDLTEDAATRGVSRDYFRHLPFTAEEMDKISNMFKGARIESKQLHEATEAELRQLVKSRPDILHLATHGFYINSEEDAKKIAFYRDKYTGSMMRSGFALSGAEEAWRGTSSEGESNDGIMTAEEVSMLDLKGTTLVTLSACETALGGYSFEGIYGLQRGFKQAGVRSMLVSLWSVNDESTAMFMQSFYEGLKEGKSKQSAWKSAVERVKGEYPEPYYWGAFVLIDP